MSVTTRHCESWLDVERRLNTFFAKPALERRRYIWRGHASSNWELTTTLDRRYPNLEPGKRATYRDLLLKEFRREALLLGEDIGAEPDEVLHMVARHHGLSSAIMDWTRSPYVAAFFAFTDPVLDTASPSDKVCIWYIDLDVATEEFGDNIVLIDDPMATRFNPRAQVQQSVFMNFVNPFQLATMSEGTLRRLEVPASERASVLARLDAQGVSGSSLLGSLDAAASVAERRTRDILGITV